MSEELKPCPFCGGDTLVIIPSTYDTRIVRCADCLAMGEAKATATQAIAAWNQRTPQRIDVYHLANVIRTVDGSHTMGAGELAEAIIKRLEGYDE